MIKKLIFISLFSISSLFALTKDEIKPEMSNKIDKVLMILKDSKMNKDKKATEIISIMNSVFDYKIMSMLSIGKTWKTATEEQREKFIKVFTEKLKDSYIKKLDLYTDELVEILGVEESKKDRILLKTQLVGKDEKYDINYKFYKSKNEDMWYIYDVDLLGVSIIQTYRKQFASFLQNKSFSDLIIHLQDEKNSL